jgi:outer membrane receptor protein involved in Fe transport
MKILLLRLTTPIIMVLVLSINTFAGNTGKIVGRVTDKATGEALVSANILVVGTQRGAVTDIDGRFTIIGVSVGTCVVRASQVGYQQVDYTDVKINADQTTELNFLLNQSAVEIQGVTISADQALVNNLSTSSTATVNSKTIENLPNVKNVEDVLKLQAGVVKQGNNLFIRGGRPNEVQYLIDGIPTNSLLANSNGAVTTAGQNEDLQKVYSGIQSGTIGGGTTGVSISATAIQSVSVQTSGFDADYGNAQSGVVSIITKSGADHYTGSLSLRSDKLASQNQNENYSGFSIGGPEPLTKYLMPNLGVSIPGSLSFFMNADADQRDGSYTFLDNIFFHPLQRQIQLNGFLGGILNGLGYTYNDKLHNDFTFNTKLKYDPSQSDQITYGYRASLSSRHDFNQGWFLRGDSSLVTATLGIQHALSWTHFFSQSSFVRVNFGKVESHDGNDVAGIKPSDYSAASPDISNETDPTAIGFNILGTAQDWYKAVTNDYSFRIDFNSQVHPLHLLKAGMEFHYEEINSTEIYEPTLLITDPRTGLPTIPPVLDDSTRSKGDYPGYGQFRWNLNNFPNHGALYVQDNIEFSGLNLHVGLRYDYFDIGKQVFYNDWVTAWKTNLGLTPDWPTILPKGQQATDWNVFKYYFLHGYYSPRLAIGYPVTDRIVFYFNYGHFIQFPDRDEYFKDPTLPNPDPNNRSVIGNPDLKPQRTVAYEASFEDQFNDDMAFKIHAFYKDNFDYPSLVLSGTQTVYVNFDYASTRGFEFALNQSYTGNLSTSISYSYQIAKGRSSMANAQLVTPGFLLPFESRLDFDQEQTLNFFSTYQVGDKEPGKFFGLPFVNNYSISLSWQYGSGLPYTPYASGAGANAYAQNVLHNTGTSPPTSTVNLSAKKGFLVMDRLNMMITLDVLNLFNRRNPNNTLIINYTGAPPQYGDYNPTTHEIYPYSQTASRLDPTMFGDLRQIVLGIQMNWE